MCSSALERREVRYRGDVQGVGFRYTTVRVARTYDVTGFVRNEPDGSVRLIVEGRPAEIEGFLQELAESMRDNIREVLSQTRTATGEFGGFGIRH
jgi:acylphosphatase